MSTAGEPYTCRKEDGLPVWHGVAGQGSCRHTGDPIHKGYMRIPRSPVGIPRSGREHRIPGSGSPSSPGEEELMALWPLVMFASLAHCT